MKLPQNIEKQQCRNEKNLKDCSNSYVHSKTDSVDVQTTNIHTKPDAPDLSNQHEKINDKKKSIIIEQF